MSKILINENLVGHYSEEDILSGAEKGDLVMNGINFFEKFILQLIQLIAGAKGRLRKRVDALEEENKLLTTQIAELQEAVHTMQLGSGTTTSTFTIAEVIEEPETKPTDPETLDNTTTQA